MNLLQIHKGGDTYLFRYAEGCEDAVMDELIRLADDDEHALDWLDAATMSYELVRRAARRYAIPVRDRVAAGRPFGLGLRLSAVAAGQLADPAALRQFTELLDREGLYVFTINGFPYGSFHATHSTSGPP